jgi:translation initiation factor eIF-2B subunit delta
MKKTNDNSSKEVALFSHLEIPKELNTSLAPKEIHPAVLVLGLQFAEFKICGANARCIATLTAFKKVKKKHSSKLYK